MKSGLLQIILLAVSTAFGTGVQAQIASTTAEQRTAIRITAPRQNLRQTANFVDVRFELTNPTASATSSPNFKIQLDSNDAVTTTTTQQSFTGLTTGTHLVTVQLVDANGALIPGSQAQVQFVVMATAQNSGAAPAGSPGTTSGGSTPPPQAKAITAPGVTAESREDSLPPASSSLPILSIVGFGVLVGGLISAMRTR